MPVVKFQSRLIAFLLVVLCTQQMYLFSLMRVRPADVLARVDDLGHQILESQQTVNRRLTDIDEEFVKRKQRMDGFDDQLSRRASDVELRSQVEQWVGEVQARNPQLDIPTVDSVCRQMQMPTIDNEGCGP